MSTRLAPWNRFEPEHFPSHRSSGEDSRRAMLPSPSNPMDELHNEIDRLFQSVFRGFDAPWSFMRGMASLAPQESALRPRLDMTGDDREYRVTVEVPGVCPDDISLEMRDGALLLRGEKKQETRGDDKGVYRMERSYGSFERILSLPEDASEDAITASHKDGVLTITIPRREKTEPETKKIAISKAE